LSASGGCDNHYSIFIRLYESLNLLQFIGSVIGWWDWFLTTISDGSMTELIAVGNRSHNHLTRIQVPSFFS